MISTKTYNITADEQEGGPLTEAAIQIALRNAFPELNIQVARVDECYIKPSQTEIPRGTNRSTELPRGSGHPDDIQVGTTLRIEV